MLIKTGSVQTNEATMASVQTARGIRQGRPFCPTTSCNQCRDTGADYFSNMDRRQTTLKTGVVGGGDLFSFACSWHMACVLIAVGGRRACFVPSQQQSTQDG